MVSPDNKSLSDLIREKALSLGFDLVGIAPFRQLTDQKETLQTWLNDGMNADMNFMSGNIDKRIDPGLLLAGAKSVIVTGMNYYPSDVQGGGDIPLISKYAYGEDYHLVIGEKLKELLKEIVYFEPGASGKICVDSSPVLEKTWAHEAGLGWIGKNSLLINKTRGSYIFLGEIVLNIELVYDKPGPENHCGECNLCMDACPTGAINKNRTIDARRCVSWLTVENKNDIPAEFKGKLGNNIFGCDICQDICPWNEFLSPHDNSRFKLSQRIKNMSQDEWESLDREKFNELFAESSLRRAGYNKIVRNIKFVTVC